MILEERLATYINSLDTGNTAFLNRIEQYAAEFDVPVIRKETQQFIKTLLAIKKPRRILEVGTAIGFSALFMAEYNPVCSEIITIENYEKRIPIARENIKEAGREAQITLIEGDAQTILPSLKETFDLIFMDAAKGQYMNFLPFLLRLLEPGGVLVSDNILHDCDVLESRYAVTRRDRTIHSRMREYLYTITHMEELETICLSVGDGVTVSTKRCEPTERS